MNLVEDKRGGEYYYCKECIDNSKKEVEVSNE